MSIPESPPPGIRPTVRDPPDARERLQQMLHLLIQQRQAHLLRDYLKLRASIRR